MRKTRHEWHAHLWVIEWAARSARPLAILTESLWATRLDFRLGSGWALRWATTSATLSGAGDVGTDVGWLVGDSVGMAVGKVVGWLVGEVVGASVGASVMMHVVGVQAAPHPGGRQYPSRHAQVYPLPVPTAQ